MARLLIGLAAFGLLACSQAVDTNIVNAAAKAATPPLAKAPANGSAPTAAQALRRGVDDPRAFVEGQYRAYQANTTPVETPSFAYSDRLRGLFAAYEARQNPDEVGSIDFDWWINAQDWQLHDVAVTQADLGPDSKIVTSHFRNVDRAEVIRFQFVRANGRWYLDDVVQGSGRGDDGWTLSALLTEPAQ